MNHLHVKDLIIMKRTLLILLTAALAISLAGPALAGAPAKRHFNEVDTNKDGKIDMGEWLQAWVDKEAARKRFHQLDRNKDGVLDDADGKIIFAERDKDANNKISRDEYVFDSSDANAARDDFVAYDSNRDSYVTWDEWSGYWPFMTYW
jgi:Ca2+-binding EF-hand superfamily protein